MWREQRQYRTVGCCVAIGEVVGCLSLRLKDETFSCPFPTAAGRNPAIVIRPTKTTEAPFPLCTMNKANRGAAQGLR